MVCSEIEQGTGGNGDSVYIVHLLTLATLYTSHSPLSKQLTVTNCTSYKELPLFLFTLYYF